MASSGSWGGQLRPGLRDLGGTAVTLDFAIGWKEVLYGYHLSKCYRDVKGAFQSHPTGFSVSLLSWNSVDQAGLKLTDPPALLSAGIRVVHHHCPADTC